ncbi:MAG: hypothetical protein WBO97_16630 [Tepidiformaceae bacterium]
MTVAPGSGGSVVDDGEAVLAPSVAAGGNPENGVGVVRPVGDGVEMTVAEISSGTTGGAFAAASPHHPPPKPATAMTAITPFSQLCRSRPKPRRCVVMQTS